MVKNRRFRCVSEGKASLVDNVMFDATICVRTISAPPPFSELTKFKFVLCPFHTILQIFKTSAFLEMRLDLDSQFSAQQIYHVEQSTSGYLKSLLIQDDSLGFLDGPTSVIDVAVDVQQQQVEGSLITLDSKVDMYHMGDQGVIDLAALLTFLVNKNNTGSSYVYLDTLIGMGSQIEAMSFGFVEESIRVTNVTKDDEMPNEDDSARTDSEKTLIVVTTILSISLFAMSAVLIWIGGGWLMLRKQVKLLLLREEEMTRITQDLKPQPTQDTEEGEMDDSDSPNSRESQTQFTHAGSGILGVNPYYANHSMRGPGALEGLGIKMTPARGRDGEFPDDLATPMSDYSDTDRGPIGIMSMRKMIPTDQEDEADSNETFGMKKLEY
jgi:hypothetical protein